MKKLTALLLALCLTATLAAPLCRAEEEYLPKYYTEAMVLNQLGLLQGVGTNPDGTPDFDLEKPATRLQALIMLIRLLGREDEAMACTAPNPFYDIDGTSTGGRYAIYAHDIALAMGRAEGEFGNANATPAQLLTFVLRALRYRDGENRDFKVSTAMDKAVEIHLLEEPISGSTLRRDEVVHICYNALHTYVKGSYRPLANKLIADGVLTEAQVRNSGVLGETVEVPFSTRTSRVKVSDIAAAFPEAAGVTVETLRSDTLRRTLSATDFSPLSVLLGSRGMEQHWSGQSGKPALHLDTDESLRLRRGSRSASVVTVLDKSRQLIGYAVATGYDNSGVLTFHTCQVDGSAALEALKTRCQTAADLPEFDSAALGLEDKTVSSGGNTYPRRVLVDAGLPREMINFTAYSVSGAASPQAAWAESHNPLTMHVPGVGLTPRGTLDSGALAGSHGTVTVLLYDKAGNALGWTRLDLT